MANSPQARKRARTQAARNLDNTRQRSAFRTAIKKVVTAIRNGDRENALTLYQQAVPIIDSHAGKGLTHKNKAARHKSRLNARIKAMGGA